MHGGADFNKLKIAHVRVGGDSLLEDRSERLAECKARQGKRNCEWQAQNPPKGGTCPSKREPGKSPGQKQSGGKVGSASGVDGESAFTGAQTRQRLCHRRLNIVGREISEDEEAGRVGMSGHVLAWIFRGEHVQCGVFERMVAAGFKNKGEIENVVHAMIIPVIHKVHEEHEF